MAQAAAFAGLFQAGGGGFAWVGWDRLTGGQRYGVYHYSPDGALEYRVTLGSVSLGESFKYKATWKNGTGEDGTIHFIVCAADGSNCTDFGSTPFQGNTWSDIEGRIVGNTNTKDADIRGIKTNKNDFTAIMWRDGKGPWQTTTSYDISSGVSRYHHTVVSNSAIRTWTDPLWRALPRRVKDEEKTPGHHCRPRSCRPHRTCHVGRCGATGRPQGPWAFCVPRRER